MMCILLVSGESIKSFYIGAVFGERFLLPLVLASEGPHKTQTAPLNHTPKNCSLPPHPNCCYYKTDVRKTTHLKTPPFHLNQLVIMQYFGRYGFRGTVFGKYSFRGCSEQTGGGTAILLSKILIKLLHYLPKIILHLDYFLSKHFLRLFLLLLVVETHSESLL